MPQVNGHYSRQTGLSSGKSLSWLAAIPLVLLVVVAGLIIKPHSQAAGNQVLGESYNICDETSQYLTSPWTYDALASGRQSYTVAQYQALSGYGTKLPPLPAYISGQASGTEAAEIFAPGSTTSVEAYNFPNSPVLYFFEGGAYGALNLQSVSGDEFIGGSATGYPEPTFDDGGAANGISAQNDSYDSPSNTTATAHLSSAAAQGATTLSLGASSLPEVPWGVVKIGSQDYTVSAVSGSQSSYTLTIVGGLDNAASSNASVYYDGLSGDVTVSYLNINNDQHGTTGTIYTGAGWTVTNNNIHDGYSTPGLGLAIYGGDQGTIQYNCISKMGGAGMNIFGANNKFDYNEVYETDYEPDPGCGCSAGGKWWGTLNADIVDNAFIDDSAGGGPPIWLDNGNSGTLISGNYFDMSYGSAIASETGYNLNVTGNLFQDGGWGSGTGCGDSNCVGAVDLNSSGGFHVPGSRYDNQITISNNQFINNWGGVNIWQSGGRSCENSGEGWPDDDPYCSGGFPNTSINSAGGQYYFSHINDTPHQWGGMNLAQSVSAGSSTVVVEGSEATDDQIGFGDPAQTTTSSTTNVAGLNGSSAINATSTASFPSSGQLRVGTSAAWSDGDGSWTGAILSYTGKTASSFTGVSFVRGTGTLSGPILQIQPYKVTGETCYANDCTLQISPSLAASATAGAEVSNAGTCQLYATSAATPLGPLAPNGTSYFDGCQWGTKNISVTGNDFEFDPATIAASAPLTGGGTTTSCTAAHADNCGTNFMAFQEAGEAPFNDFTNGNSMMSSSTFTTCPSWDSGCTTDPLNNINALSNPPSAPAHNSEPSNNNVWSDNTYTGPWQWNTDWYGNCSTEPTDPTTGKSMPGGACNVDFAHWQSDWQQDAGSTYMASPSPTPSSSPTPTPTPTPTPSVSPTPSPTPAPSNKVGDLNNDNSVNIFDLSILLSNWGVTNSTIENNLGHSGPVDIFDLSILLSHWGT